MSGNDHFSNRSKIYLVLVPFLVIYLGVSFFLSPVSMFADEGRYLKYAKNILQGFYSPPAPDIDIWNGPGYSLFIAPFLLIKLSPVYLRLLNAVLFYLSLLIIFKTIHIYCSDKTSLAFTTLLGLYYPAYQVLPLIMSECLAWFLISLICHTFIRYFNSTRNNLLSLFLPAFAIAYLAVTRVIFGYVILVMLILALFMMCSCRYRVQGIKAFKVYLFSLIFCMPWLFYTYTLTGNAFYWSNSGGSALYCMTSPFPNDLGDWINPKNLRNDPNHKEFMARIFSMKAIERDREYKKISLQNIRNHPGKYLSNWIANLGRLFFSYPFSNSCQSTSILYTIVPDALMVVLLLLSILMTAFFFRSFPPELTILLIFFLVYLGGSSLVSAYKRMFYITMPFWTIYISFLFTKVFSISVSASPLSGDS